jgi:general secretion pathway protein D
MAKLGSLSTAVLLTVATVLVWAQNPPVAIAPPGSPGAPTAGQPSPQAPTQTAEQPPATAPKAKALNLPQPGQVPAGLNLENASLVEVVDILARALKINYILDPRVKGNVTINTYGEIKPVDVRPLLDTILRVNGDAMVQVGDLYRIVPLTSVPQLPIPPEMNAKDIPEDERTLLDLVFLKYVTVSEIAKLLEPFLGESAKMTVYEPANLLLILDNGRNMRRTMQLISMFDSDTLAGQRVRLFEVTNGRPSDIAKELENVFKAYALSEKNSAVKFMPIDRINTIIAVAPNPGVFVEVDKWLKKLDVPVKVTAGSIDNYVYRIKYQRAEIVGSAIMQLYGGAPGGYGGGYGAGYGGFGSGLGGLGGGYQGGMYGGGSAGGYGMGGYGMGGYGAGYAGGYGSSGGYQTGAYGAALGNSPTMSGLGGSALAGQSASIGSLGTPVSGLGTGTTGDLTGSYLGAGMTGGYGYPMHPRIIPNPLDNTLLIQGTPQEWEQIKNLIQQIDIPPRQVLIEAKVYEIDLTGELSAGVEAYIQKRGPSSDRAYAGSSNGTNSSFTPGLNVSAGFLVGQARELLSFLQATETTTKSKVISAPSVIATDSIQASINVGETVPALSSSTASNVSVSGTTAFANNITNVDTGVQLNILARVNPSGVVTMQIDQDVSAPTPPPSGVNVVANSPSFSQRKVKTQVTVQDGDTISIGGIIQETDSSTSSGIPYLHRLPVVGALFGNKSRNTSRTELIVFLTPHVIYDTNQIAEATEELKSRLKRVGKLMKDE